MTSSNTIGSTAQSPESKPSFCEQLNVETRLQADAQKSVERARVAVQEVTKKAGWTPLFKDRRVVAAEQQLEAAQANAKQLQSVSRVSRESILRSSAVETNDTELIAQLDRRAALSGMMGTLKDIAESTDSALRSSRRADASGKVGTGALALAVFGKKETATKAAFGFVAAKVVQSSLNKKSASAEVAMMESVERFNSDAVKLGLPGFNSEAAVGVAAEINTITKKTAAALQDTLSQLDTRFEALAGNCR